MRYFNIAVWLLLFLVTALQFVRSIRLVPNRREYILERLGRYNRTLGAGFHVLIPFVDRVRFIQDLREESMEVPPQECFTKDNVQVEVDGVIYISVMDSKNASYGVTNYRNAAVRLAQTTTRSVIGTLELDRTFEEREAINARVVSVLAEVGQSWGIRVHRYEVKNIVTPPTVRDAMERQMTAERDRRAVIARAEGEAQARINDSEGRRAEMINRADGEKQRRINEAEGRAREILAIAEATADSIREVGGALRRPGGIEAMELQLKQDYLTTLRGLASQNAEVLLPADLSNPERLLSQLKLPAIAPDEIDHEPAPEPVLKTATEPIQPPSVDPTPVPKRIESVVPPEPAPAPASRAPSAPTVRPEEAPEAPSRRTPGTPMADNPPPKPMGAAAFDEPTRTMPVQGIPRPFKKDD